MVGVAGPGGSGAPGNTQVWSRTAISSPTAIERRTSRDSSEPRSFNCAATAWIAVSSSIASARSSSPWTARVPSKECTWRDSTVKYRPSACSRRRASASTGMYRPIASSTSRSSGTGPIRCAVGATCRSTNPAASMGQEEGLLGDPPRQPRPQTTRTAPASTPAGSRYRSSRAWPTYRFPASVDMPSAAANSVTENSATNGAPSPATGIPASPYAPAARVSASRIESTECIAAQFTACCNSRASAASAIARSARAAASTAAAVSVSGVVSIMRQLKHRPPTLQRPEPRG